MTALPGSYDRADLDDIPGTTVFTIGRSRQAYQLHRFCMSLMKADNRAAFLADQEAYLDQYPMTSEQRAAVLARDYSGMVALGANIFFLVKIASTDGQSTAQAVSTMTEHDAEQYVAMMVAGGRSPDGIRSKRGAY